MHAKFGVIRTYGDKLSYAPDKKCSIKQSKGNNAKTEQVRVTARVHGTL